MKRMPYLQPLNIDGATGFEARFTEPTTVKSVLLERWAKDTEVFAKETISCFYDGYHESYDFPNGARSYNEQEAIKLYIAYLNSAAEVGK